MNTFYAVAVSPEEPRIGPYIAVRGVIVVVGGILASLAAQGPGDAIGAVVTYILFIAAWGYVARRRKRAKAPPPSTDR